jgi:hypothetical protein
MSTLALPSFPASGILKPCPPETGKRGQGVGAARQPYLSYFATGWNQTQPGNGFLVGAHNHPKKSGQPLPGIYF